MPQAISHLQSAIRTSAILLVIMMLAAQTTLADAINDANQTLDTTDRAIEGIDRAASRGKNLFDRFKGMFKGNAASTTSPEVYEVQQLLSHLGYDPGLVDGRSGPRTTQAISLFQRQNNMPVDGRISPYLLSRLRDTATRRTQPVTVPTTIPTTTPAAGQPSLAELSTLPPELLQLLSASVYSAAADAHQAVCIGSRDGRFRNELLLTAQQLTPRYQSEIAARYDAELARVWPQVVRCDPATGQWLAQMHRLTIAALAPGALPIPAPTLSVPVVSTPAAVSQSSSITPPRPDASNSTQSSPPPAPQLPAITSSPPQNNTTGHESLSNNLSIATKPEAGPSPTLLPPPAPSSVTQSLSGHWYWMKPGEENIILLGINNAGEFHMATENGAVLETGMVEATADTLYLTAQGSAKPETYRYVMNSENEISLTDDNNETMVLLRNFTVE